MADVFSPNLIGDVRLNGNAGIVGQYIRSAGSATQATWATHTNALNWAGNTLTSTANGVVANQVLSLVSADVGNTAVAGTDGRVYVAAGSNAPYKFTSASNTSHTITHNLNNQYPNVTVYDTVSGEVVIPSTIVGTSVNVLTVTFGVARAIAGTVVG